ncbi:MAG: hypothetical protein EP329_08840 [Deltaproteobacteria bacterium]|nr:MAG: hypothetical protein EP329_08840 [Deltaproteobacteria bacterium]
MNDDTRWVAFVRHGTYAKVPGAARATQDQQPLTPLGVEEAKAAGDFLAGELARLGLRLTRVLRTSTKRTGQTAELVLSRCRVDDARMATGTLGRLADLGARMSQESEGMGPDELLLVVGHGNTLGALMNVVGLTARAFERDHGAVILCRRDVDRWTAWAYFPSVPSA